jgi:hypothetical protein
MSKIIEFKVYIANIVVGGTKEKKYHSKSYEKLMKSLPKEVKRKWQTIRYFKEGVEIVIKREDGNT